METKLFSKKAPLTAAEKQELVLFLHTHLEQYGDSLSDIEKAINYALSESASKGGFVLASYRDSQLSGAVVVNRTGMDSYIPENILVYIAMRRDLRGMGIGKQLLLKAIASAQGNIALHVEPDNPARYLYQKIGFENKYLEMRYFKQ